MSADDPHFERSRNEAQDPSDALAEALARSRRHARASLSEAIACVRALLDAASLATTGVPAEAHGLLQRLATTLSGAADGLAPDGGGSELLDAVAAALDDEIARWETRAKDDAEARSVLRAFLGVRELLWELGVRPQRDKRPRGPQVARPESRREPVQRVHVQGAGTGA